jgi:hypothetical protein
LRLTRKTLLPLCNLEFPQASFISVRAIPGAGDGYPQTAEVLIRRTIRKSQKRTPRSAAAAEV